MDPSSPLGELFSSGHRFSLELCSSSRTSDRYSSLDSRMKILNLRRCGEMSSNDRSWMLRPNSSRFSASMGRIEYLPYQLSWIFRCYCGTCVTIELVSQEFHSTCIDSILMRNYFYRGRYDSCWQRK